MMKFFQLLVGCVLTLTALTVRAEVLWWSTGTAGDIEVTYEGTTETTTAAELGAVAARMRVEDTDIYLPYIVPDGEGGYITGEGFTVYQIPVPDIWTDIGSYGAAGKSFVIELGNWSADGETWVTKASATVQYSAIADYLGADILSVPSYTPWQATGFTAVPEPTSGLLTLLGLAVLALRRKRMS